mgnify:CR=1 FL=1
MLKPSLISRREFLKLAGIGTVGITSSQLLASSFIGKVIAQSDTIPDLEVRLSAVESEVSIFSGSLTSVWTYQGEVLQGEHFIDVGTGPGLPGIPLAILYPEKSFVLLDSLGKRITFLRQVVFQLKLTNVKPVKSRVEQYQADIPFDGVLSRAFSSLNDMVTWCSHLTTEQKGKFFALKGQYPVDELADLPENIELVSSHEIKVPELIGERHVLILKKN